MTMAALQVKDLYVWYAQKQAVKGVNLHAKSGEAVALIGHKGSGRRSALMAISGQNISCKGSILVIGQESIHRCSPDVSSLGLGLGNIESSINNHLTCEENLLMPSPDNNVGGGMALGNIYEVCPELKVLKHATGNELNKVQRRMLAIARVLRHGARIILLNDIAVNLSGVHATQLARFICNLKQKGYCIVLTEQGTDFCGQVADRFYVLSNGYITKTFNKPELNAKLERQTEGSNQQSLIGVKG